MNNTLMFEFAVRERLQRFAYALSFVEPCTTIDEAIRNVEISSVFEDLNMCKKILKL